MNTMVAHAATIASGGVKPGMRRRRGQAAPTTQQQQQQQDQPQTSPAGFMYHVRQYAGFMLCIIAMVGTGWISMLDLSSTHMTLGICGFLVLAAVALVLHELRPFVGPTFDDIHTFKQQQAHDATAKRD